MVSVIATPILLAKSGGLYELLFVAALMGLSVVSTLLKKRQEKKENEERQLHLAQAKAQRQSQGQSQRQQPPKIKPKPPYIQKATRERPGLQRQTGIPVTVVKPAARPVTVSTPQPSPIVRATPKPPAVRNRQLSQPSHPSVPPTARAISQSQRRPATPTPHYARPKHQAKLPTQKHKTAQPSTRRKSKPRTEHTPVQKQTTSDTLSRLLLALDKPSDLARGIVYAEILGPPKALRPPNHLDI